MAASFVTERRRAIDAPRARVDPVRRVASMAWRRVAPRPVECVHAATATLASTPRGHPHAAPQERALELPGLIGGEAGEKRLALNLPPPDLEEDTLMEKDEAPGRVLEGGGEGEAPSNADKRKFAEEQYERRSRRPRPRAKLGGRLSRRVVALCAATVAPPDAEDVLVKWTGLGYDEAVEHVCGPTCWRRVPIGKIWIAAS